MYIFFWINDIQAICVLEQMVNVYGSNVRHSDITDSVSEFEIPVHI